MTTAFIQTEPVKCCASDILSIQNKTYLVKGWQGGLIKIMLKDNLLKSSSVIP